MPTEMAIDIANCTLFERAYISFGSHRQICNKAVINLRYDIHAHILPGARYREYFSRQLMLPYRLPGHVLSHTGIMRPLENSASIILSLQYIVYDIANDT